MTIANLPANDSARAAGQLAKVNSPFQQALNAREIAAGFVKAFGLNQT